VVMENTCSTAMNNNQNVQNFHLHPLFEMVLDMGIQDAMLHAKLAKASPSPQGGEIAGCTGTAQQ